MNTSLPVGLDPNVLWSSFVHYLETKSRGHYQQCRPRQCCYYDCLFEVGESIYTDDRPIAPSADGHLGVLRRVHTSTYTRFLRL